MPNRFTETTGLAGLSPARAAAKVMQVASQYGKGLHRDHDWSGVHGVLNALRGHGFDVDVERSEYAWRDGKMNSKTWWFRVTYEGRGGDLVVLRGQITAHGAGTVSNPLSAYDITTLVSER